MDRVWMAEALRRTLSLSGEEREVVAAACGVSVATVSHWITGRVVPTTPQLATFAHACGIPLDTLMSEMGYDVQPATSFKAWYLARRAAGQTPAPPTRGARLHSPLRRGGHTHAADGDMSADDPEGGRHSSWNVGTTGLRTALRTAS